MKVMKKFGEQRRVRAIEILQDDWAEMLGDFLSEKNIHVSFKRHRIHGGSVMIFGKCPSSKCEKEYRIEGEVIDGKIGNLTIVSVGSCEHTACTRPLQGKARKKLSEALSLHSTSEYHFKLKAGGLQTHSCETLRKAKSETTKMNHWRI